MVWLILGAISLLLIIALLCFSYVSLQREVRFIQLTGIGTVRFRPDEASVTIGLRTDNIADTEIAPALELNSAKFGKIIDTIRGLIPGADIETRTYSISPSNAIRPDNKYTIYNSAVVQVHGVTDLTQLSNLIRIAVQNGSNSISNVQYSLSDAEFERARLASQKLALADAQKKAQLFAAKINANVTDVYQILDLPFSQQSRSFSISTSDFQDGILFVPQDIDITAQIIVKFSIV